MFLDPCENTARRDRVINQTHPTTSPEKKEKKGCTNMQKLVCIKTNVCIENMRIEHMPLLSGGAVL